MDLTSVLVGATGGAVLAGLLVHLLSKANATAAVSTHQANAAALQSQLVEAKASLDAERAKRSTAEQSVAATLATLSERDLSIAALTQLSKSAHESLVTEFKAAGGEVLKDARTQLSETSKAQQEVSSKDLLERQAAIAKLVEPLQKQLDEQKKLVTDLANVRAQDAGKLSKELEQITRLQEQATKAASGLESALRDNRRRGRWGEVALKNILELSGMTNHVDFQEQTSVEVEGVTKRPDVIVRLPGGRVIPIDAKVPLSAYMRILDKDVTEAEILACRIDHAAALRSHVKVLASREYAKAVGEGVDFTVLFLPIESAMTAALEADPEIYQFALDSRVIITTPALLLALLRTCAIQWQQAKLADNARHIGEKATELVDRVKTFADHLDKVRKGLDQASKGYNDAIASYNGRLLPGSRDLAEMAGRNPAELDELPFVQQGGLRSVIGSDGT